VWRVRPCLLSLSRLLPSTTPRTARLVYTPRPHKRNFTHTRSIPAALATQRPPPPTTLVHAPSPKDIEDAEYDVDLLPPDKARIQLTDQAAQQLRSISQRQNDPNVALRVSVESGGCHGYQYKLHLAHVRQPDDYMFSHPTIKPSNIVIDAVSMSLLNGSTVDFMTELIGSSFQVLDNPQSKGSGCGCGVSWELKL